MDTDLHTGKFMTEIFDDQIIERPIVCRCPKVDEETAM